MLEVFLFLMDLGTERKKYFKDIFFFMAIHTVLIHQGGILSAQLSV